VGNNFFREGTLCSNSGPEIECNVDEIGLMETNQGFYETVSLADYNYTVGSKIKFDKGV
jgi:hypothetical protein